MITNYSAHFVKSISTTEFSFKNSINSTNITLRYPTVRLGNAASREILLEGNSGKFKMKT